MADRTRYTANLVSDNNLYVDITTDRVGIGTTIPTSKLTVDGDTYITGILTANRIFSEIYGEFVGGSFSGTDIVGTSLSISGISTLGLVQISSGIITATSGVITYYGDGSNLTGVYASTAGIASYASSAGIATYAVSAGIATYSSTSDIATYAISSGIATYADTAGIATVSQGFTGTPNITVGIVTASSFIGSGTSITDLNATNLTSGIVPAARITSTSALSVGGDLFVSGNISFGGTTTQLNTTQLTFSDPDLVLGIGTTSTFNPTDNTANHGGIAVASTEGSPLVSLAISPLEVLPDTYKKFMWFKNNTSGLGTDAWLSNYAVGIGSTQFPFGTRFASGNIQFTENDISIVRNINSSGIITASSFVGNLTGTATTATNLSDAANITTGTINSARLSGTYDINVSYANTSGIATVSQGLTGTPSILITNLNASGISTLGTVQISSGIITASSGVVTYYGDGSNLTGVVGTQVVTQSAVATPVYPTFANAVGVSSIGISTTQFVFIPSSGNVGIGTTNPTQTLQIQGNARITGAIYDSTNSPGTSGQVLQSTVTGTQWTNSATNVAAGGGIFDTTIDNVLYVQPTGTLDIVGVGTTTSQITTLPAGSNEYIIHSMHVTNVSNGDAEITAAFIINAKQVPASISVGGGPGIHTITVGSASSIVVGMAVTGTGNSGDTTGIGTTGGFQYNTYITSVDSNILTLSKPLSGAVSGTAYFSPVSDVVYRLPVPVGSAVELLKQPFVLNALDSIVLQSTGAGSGIGSTSTAAISQTSGSNFLTVTAGAAITNFIASGQLINGTGSNTGIQTGTYVGVGYTPGSLSVPMTKPATSTLSSQILSFTETVVPQDGALQATIVYQSTTDTAYLNGTGTATTTLTAYYGTGNTYPSTIQSIRVANVSEIGDYPVWVGIGNSDTIFSWLAYNMVIPKNSNVELCEAPKRLGIGQSIFAYSDTPNVIEIQIAGKQKTS